MNLVEFFYLFWDDKFRKGSFLMKRFNAYRMSIVIGLTLGLIAAWASAMSNELNMEDISFSMGGLTEYPCCKYDIGDTKCPGDGCSVDWKDCVRGSGGTLTCKVETCRTFDQRCAYINQTGWCE